MEQSTIQWQGLELPVIDLEVAVVGSGAAGFSAACHLDGFGLKNIAIITEGVTMGTSRNTGSDKQTYYKLSLGGPATDSVQDMAQTLFGGGSMDGDIALVEAAMSARSFMRLVELGVPFPHNEFGEYAGYRTDHDERLRATSAGPLTSRYMTEALEAEAQRRDIPILDGMLVIAILTPPRQGKECLGLLALELGRLHEPARGLTLIRTANVIWATGGEAGLFESSVYPQSQHGALGVALAAGAQACNLQEWQHGLASTTFRWNVSGTYQQVLPRYVSTDAAGGDEKEFLLDHWSPAQALAMTFLKGYQWPFDARKVPGSSLVDLYVTVETAVKGRRVFLDYRSNPAGLESGFGGLSHECHRYLENSGALFGNPYDRLKKMNPGAIELYRAHGIDLQLEMLEVAVCAQHMNGGLAVDRWWHTDVVGLYACGEAAGTFGAYRPGGSALNSTQTGSLRAARHIAANRRSAAVDGAAFDRAAAEALGLWGAQALHTSVGSPGNLHDKLALARHRMSLCGAHLRRDRDIAAALADCEREITGYWNTMRLNSIDELPDAFRGWDMYISQYTCLASMLEYIKAGGSSRGSALVLADGGTPLPGTPWQFKPYDEGMDGSALMSSLMLDGGTPRCSNELRPVRPIPERDLWFETVWSTYRAGLSQ